MNQWNHLPVCKQMSSGLFKMLAKNYSFTNHIYPPIYIYMSKNDLAINNLQGLIYYKTKPTFSPIKLWCVFLSSVLPQLLIKLYQCGLEQCFSNYDIVYWHDIFSRCHQGCTNADPFIICTSTYFKKLFQYDLEYTNRIPFNEVRPSSHRGFLDVTINYIQWWGSTSLALGSVD